MQNSTPLACPLDVRGNRQFVRKGTTLEDALMFDARLFRIVATRGADS